MRNQPLVSVILPAYNAQAFITETLNSVLAQTYSNFEVLVVDDGSTDSTPSIIKCAAQRDPRIKFLRQCNQGVAAARNLAIKQSAGDYIAPIDADDLWYPGKLERQVAVLEEAGTRAGVAYVWYVSIDQEGQFLKLGPKVDLNGNVIKPLLMRNFLGNASTPLIRRTYLELIGGYDVHLRDCQAQGCEDWDLGLRLAEVCEFRVVKEWLVAYRCHNLSMSFNHKEMGKSYDLVLDAVRQRHPKIPARIFRWSKAIFCLYLSRKSNAVGDLQNAFRWVARALREDAAVLLLPWVNAFLLKGLVRLMVSPFVYLIWRDQRAWRRVRRGWMMPSYSLSYKEIVELGNQPDPPPQLWERVQLRRWLTLTSEPA